MMSLAKDRFEEKKRAYREYLPVIERIQAGLRADADLLAGQEGWDEGVKGGIIAWIEDRGNAFRFLRRSGYDEDKAYNALLSAIPNRIKYGLHAPIPSIHPYTASPLFYILPLPLFSDRLGRPIAVLTPREVVRNEDGLENLVQWVWWASEMVRRTLEDYWDGRRWGGRGMEGEGMVVIIDAAGAGYRNIEVELFPRLGEIGSKNFPGTIDVAYVVNAGWTQRGLWKVLQKVIPRSASKKITFVDSPNDMEDVFDLDRLPSVYGGRHAWTFSTGENTVLQYYQKHPLQPLVAKGQDLISRDSTSSMMDVFYSALNSPIESHAVSRQPSLSDVNHETASSATSTSSSTTQPFKEYEIAVDSTNSLRNFNLYLSPSRRAPLSLPADPHTAQSPTSNIFAAMAATRPAILSRRNRPSLQLANVQQHKTRSYSFGLKAHHARELSNLDSRALPSSALTNKRLTPASVAMSSSSSSSSSSISTQPTNLSTPSQPPTPDRQTKPISAYSRSTNPFYGYPAMLVTSLTDPRYTSLRPVYGRRRKRDLAKMLLFLFMMKIQGMRQSLLRAVGLGRSGTDRKDVKGKDPAEGLRELSRSQGTVRRRDYGRERELLLMVAGFLLARATWDGVIAMGMQVLGLGGTA